MGGGLPAVFSRRGKTPEERTGSWYLMGPIRQAICAGARGSSFAAWAMVGVQGWAKLLGRIGRCRRQCFCSGCRYLVMQGLPGKPCWQVFSADVGGKRRGFWGWPRGLCACVASQGDLDRTKGTPAISGVTWLGRVRVPRGGWAWGGVFLMSLGVIRGPALPDRKCHGRKIGSRRTYEPLGGDGGCQARLGYRPVCDVTEESISTGAVKR